MKRVLMPNDKLASEQDAGSYSDVIGYIEASSIEFQESLQSNYR